MRKYYFLALTVIPTSLSVLALNTFGGTITSNAFTTAASASSLNQIISPVRPTAPRKVELMDTILVSRKRKLPARRHDRPRVNERSGPPTSLLQLPTVPRRFMLLTKRNRFHKDARHLPELGGVWLALRMCESGNNYRTDTGNGYYGAYQFAPATWSGIGYKGLPNQASPTLQDQAAIRLQSISGWNAWPQCSAELGL